MNEFVVYILYSSNYDKIYIGFTSSITERFKSHNIFDKKGATYKFRPWKVVHIEFYNSKAEAMNREKQLKGGQGREWIRKQVLHDMIIVGFISALGGRGSTPPLASKNGVFR